MFQYLIKPAIAAIMVMHTISSSANPTTRMDDGVVCLADNIYFEARGQGIQGWKAVANVVRNRVNNKKYPDDVCDVVYQRKQFSWTLYDRADASYRDNALYRKIVSFSRQFLYNKSTDNTNGALFYHSKKVAKTAIGVSALHKTATIGDHIFYRLASLPKKHSKRR